MATKEEVLAAAAKFEAAGQPEKAAKLRAHAATMTDEKAAPDLARIQAAEKKFRDAGQTEKADKLAAYAKTLAPVETAPPVIVGPALPPRADYIGTSDDWEKAKLAAFEKYNPKLAGKYKQDDELPAVGVTVPGVYDGGGGRSGGIPYVVKGKPEKDSFGETAVGMMEGPMAAAGAFAGGLTGSNESPTAAWMKEKGIYNGPFAGGLAAVGDIGGAGLSLLGAGMGGAIGLGTELVPGQGSNDEGKLATDLLGMSMFAVPELAGVSSVAGRVASAAPRIAGKVDAIPAPAKGDLAASVAAAEKRGIPVYRSDVSPPTGGIGRTIQQAGEAIPFAGTSGMRQGQQTARLKAVDEFIKGFGADVDVSLIPDVADALLKKHGDDVTRLATAKNGVIEGLGSKGAVQTPGAFAAIDKQIEKLSRGTKDVADQVIPVLQQWKADMVGKSLPEVELIRKQIGERFSGMDAGSIRSSAQGALDAVYGPLRADMGDFIKAVGGAADFKRWKGANDRLSAMIETEKKTALGSILNKAEETPETVRRMLFSAKPSDMATLAASLPARGMAAARTAIVQEILGKAMGVDGAISLDKFTTAMRKAAPQFKAFFKGDDLEAAEGLTKALQLTRQAGDVQVPKTGARLLPLLLGGGAVVSGGGAAAGAGILGTIGLAARLYESTGVQGALRQLNKAQSPGAVASALRRLDHAADKATATTKKTAVPAAGAQAVEPDYDGLLRRYAQ